MGGLNGGRWEFRCVKNRGATGCECDWGAVPEARSWRAVCGTLHGGVWGVCMGLFGGLWAGLFLLLG